MAPIVLMGGPLNPASLVVGGAAVASKLAFGVQPSSEDAGVPIAPAFTVQVLDADGRLVVSSTAAITVSRQVGPGVISGTLTRNAVSGVATFNDIALDTAGTHTIAANASGLTGTSSVHFDISGVGGGDFPEEPVGAVALTNGVISMAWDSFIATTPETDAQPFNFVDRRDTSSGTDATAPHNPGTNGIGRTRFTDATVGWPTAGNTLSKYESSSKLIPPDASSLWFYSFWLKMTGTNPRIYVNGLKLWNMFQTGSPSPTSILEVYPANIATGAGPWHLGWVFQGGGSSSSSDQGPSGTFTADTWVRASVTINFQTKQHRIYLGGVLQSTVTNSLTMGAPSFLQWDWVYGGGPCQSSGQDWFMYHDGQYASVVAL